MPETVVITGASAGVGRATARLFAAEGARIGLIARGEDGLRGAAAEIEEAGGEALVLPTDVADPEAVEAAAERVERRWGGIDLWINAAMTTIFAPVERITPKEFARATAVTYLGTVHGTMSALKRMRRRDQGTIVQVGSALSYRAIPLQSAYCGAKFAIRGFTDSLRCELLHERSRIHLTMVQMPALDTPQFDWCRNRLSEEPQPVPPIFMPEVAARAIRFAARRRRREIYVGGSTVAAILGTKIAPGLLDRMLARKGWDGQLSGRPAQPGKPDNLFAPVPGDHGAHGRFGPRSSRHSPALWLTRHRTAIAAGVAALAVLMTSRAAARSAG